MGSQDETAGDAVVELRSVLRRAGHDLRAPTRQVKAFVELIRRHEATGLPAQVVQACGHIDDAIDELTSLIGRLDAYCEVAATHPRPERVSLRCLVSDAWSDSLARRPGCTGHLQSHDLPEAETDPRLLRHLLLLVFDDALGSSTPNGAARVQVSGHRMHDALELVVDEDGHGLSAGLAVGEVRELAGAPDDRDGTVCNRALLRRVALHLGGRLSLEATPRGGTRVRLQIPQRTAT